MRGVSRPALKLNPVNSPPTAVGIWRAPILLPLNDMSQTGPIDMPDLKEAKELLDELA